MKLAIEDFDGSSRMVACFGYLRRVDTSFRCFLAAKVYANGSASDVLVAEWEQLWRTAVAYQMNPEAMAPSIPGTEIVGNDTFSFVVYDSDVNNSAMASINVTAVASVWALPLQETWRCYEDMDCDIPMYGDTTADTSNMSFTVVVVPDASYGHFIDKTHPGNHTLVAPGYRLSGVDDYPYGDGVSVTYVPPDDFFTVPDVMWNGTEYIDQPKTLTFRYFASVHLSEDTAIKSKIVEQVFDVLNVDDSSILNCSDVSYTVNSLGFPFDDENGTIQRPDQAPFTGFTITDRDRSVDAIRLSISGSAGVLTIPGAYLSALDFSWGCDDWVSVWCLGDGWRDRNPTFIGQPVDVEKALNSMYYESYLTSYVDNFTITTFDGSGDSCRGSFEHPSVRPVCVEFECEFSVKVTTYYVEEPPESLITVGLWTGVAIYSSLFCCCLQILCKPIKTFRCVKASCILFFKFMRFLYRIPHYIRLCRRFGWRMKPISTAVEAPAEWEHSEPSEPSGHSQELADKEHPLPPQSSSNPETPWHFPTSPTSGKHRHVVLSRDDREEPVSQAVPKSSALKPVSSPLEFAWSEE